MCSSDLFEAVSRGARSAVLVERARQVVRTLEANAGALAAADAVEIVASTVEQWLTRKPSRAFDIVFIDPPYAAHCDYSAAHALNTGGWLAAEAFVYVESSARGPDVDVPSDWGLYRARKAGEVRYHLYCTS